MATVLTKLRKLWLQQRKVLSCLPRGFAGRELDGKLAFLSKAESLPRQVWATPKRFHPTKKIFK
jgi:hypothetical protein